VPLPGFSYGSGAGNVRVADAAAGPRWKSRFRGKGGRERVRKEDTRAPGLPFLAVLNLDSEAVNHHGLAVDLRPVLQKDLVSAWHHRWKQEAVAVSIGKSTAFSDKSDLAIDTLGTIEECPNP